MSFVDDTRLGRLLQLSAEPELIAERFELDTALGEGGMGVVFEAWDRQTERCVALKLLRDLDAAAEARFEREAQALCALSHPGIVGYIAHGSTAQGQRYLAMERLVGVTLAARLAQGPLGVGPSLRVGRGAAAALAAAHRQGLVHRDLKPSNLFLEEGDPGRVKLLDFGLARGASAAALTRTGALVGTPGYMAPEQVRGGPADARADLFALGAVLFECVSGRPPFLAADTEGVLARSLVQQAPALRQLCPDAPPALEVLVARLLAAEPAQRPADAAEVERELSALLGEPLPAPALAAPAPASDPAQPGALLAGKYRVLGTLGSGGMGIVLLARHETLERAVAIKLLRRGEQERSSAAVARLVREAQAASRLESEHVARVMDVGALQDGAPFIVMEYLSGQDLAQVLRERQRLPVDVALDYVLQAAEALAEAHALGIVHRDLKPSNLFLTARRDGTPLIKVLDFGISKLAPASDAALAAEASITAPDAILGSPLYMSPEQLHSSKRVDARTDIWSLGVVLQQLLTGRPPFEADGFLAIAASIAAAPPAELRAGCPEAPEGLARVVRRCLEKDPAQRFGSLAELALALRPYAPERSRVSLERLARAAPQPAPAASRPASPWRRAVLLAGAAALALGALLLFFPGRAAVRRQPAAVGTSAPPLVAPPAPDPARERPPPAEASPTAPAPSKAPQTTASPTRPARPRPAPRQRRATTASSAAPAAAARDPDALNPALLRR